MGAFSGKTTVNVSSTLYNLSGEEANRPEYLKSNLFSSIIQDKSKYLGESLVGNYLSGPGIKQRQFFNWAVRNDYYGLPSLSVQTFVGVDGSVIEPFITAPDDHTTRVIEAELFFGDYTLFAEQYMYKNHIDLIATDWISDFNSITQEITIQFEDASTEIFNAPDYDINAKYIAAYYEFVNQDNLSVGDVLIYIYKIGSGNATLDALDTTVTVGSSPEFYPFIPIRLNNKSIKHEDFEDDDVYADARAAYRKLTERKSFTELIENVEDNDDIAQLDYVYLDFGVPLNVKRNSGKKYIHQFLKNMIPYQTSDSADMAQFILDIQVYQAAISAHQNWKANNTSGSGENQELNDDAVPPPTFPKLIYPDVTTVRMKTDSQLISSYDVRISWLNIQEEIISGKHEINASVGDCRLEKGPSLDLPVFGGNALFINKSMKLMYVYRQISENSYSKISTYGLQHRNYIYGGNHVFIDTDDALDETDEDSGFLIPMHQPTIKSMSLVDTTQIATENTFLVINTYQIYKQKWYQTGIFQIIIVILLIIVAVFISPQLAAQAVGILGTNAAVGVALGLTGTAAIVAGAVANALVGLFVAKILTAGATSLFGEKIGAIIGAVLSFVVAGGLNGNLASFSFASADNILQLANVLANGYAGWTQANIIDINNQLTSNKTEYEESLDKINELLSELGGTNDLSFNPLELTDVNIGNDRAELGYLPESLDEFIQRTTMVGSDIVEITLSMITDYADLAKQLPRN